MKEIYKRGVYSRTAKRKIHFHQRVESFSENLYATVTKPIARQQGKQFNQIHQTLNVVKGSDKPINKN